jgi:hypothetical protein
MAGGSAVAGAPAPGDDDVTVSEGCDTGVAVEEPMLTPAEIAALEGKAFSDALQRLAWRDELPPNADLYPLLERCGARGSTSFDYSFACSSLVKRVVQSASASDEEWLWRLYDGLDADSEMRRSLVRAFLDRHLHRVSATLPKAPQPVRFEFQGEVPERLATAPTELVEAWKLYEAARLAFEQRPGSRTARGEREDDIPVQSHFPEFYGTIADYLRGRATADATVASLDRFVWGGWCGTGSSSLSDRKSVV